ncbi:MAG: [ribosomal protein S18]-alanine N-acetyltransferase [Clostridiales bacterium]|nr:[ribosomal protein S18]-alanine N-acetyltransferase [Clostridiales bacterium]
MEQKNDSIVQVTEMRLSDLDDVEEIERLCFPTPWSKEAFRTEIMRNFCARYAVARLNGRVVGYIGMWLVIDEAHITNVAVHPDYRHRGIGEKLMRYMMKMAVDIGISRMTLEVRKSNIVAQKLYKKLGFEESGIRKGYYLSNNEDAIIMWNFHLT